MSESGSQAEDVARLVALRARVRDLVGSRRWLADAFRDAFERYQLFCHLWRQGQSELHNRELELAREILKTGRLRDPSMKRGRHMVVIEGMCPARLAQQLKKANLDSLPKALEQRAAKAALAALERDIVRQSKDLPAQECEKMAAESLAAINKQTHVNFEWRVFVRRPDDWVEPPCPHSMEQKTLGLFSKEDFRSIAMYHLGGLADVGAVHPIVPEPKGEGLAAAAALTSWRSRLPIDDRELGSPDPELSRTKLPPGLAEQMLSAVSVWVAEMEDVEEMSPAARLCLALIRLKGVLGDGAPFTELSVRRSEQSRLQRAAFDAAGRGLCVSLMDTKSMAELATRFLDGSMPREPSDYLQRLSDVLVEADRHCQDAIVATSLGGVRKIDRSVNPGAAEASLAWDVRIQRTQEQLARVRWWLRAPRLVVEEDLRGIRETGDWLEQAIAELKAAERVAGREDEKSGDANKFAHAPDFTWIIWCGHHFTFSKGNQAESMKYLWSAWEQGGRRDGCGLSEKTIGKQIDRNKDHFRLAPVFRRRQDIWNKVIRSTASGVFALFSIENPPRTD